MSIPINKRRRKRRETLTLPPDLVRGKASGKNTTFVRERKRVIFYLKSQKKYRILIDNFDLIVARAYSRLSLVLNSSVRDSLCTRIS